MTSSSTCVFIFNYFSMPIWRIWPFSDYSHIFKLLTPTKDQSNISYNSPVNFLAPFFPSSSLHPPAPCFTGCLLHDEVHILRDFGSHLHFPLSPLFGVSVLLMQAQGPQKGERDTHTMQETERESGREEVGTQTSSCTKYTTRSIRRMRCDLLHGFIK